MLHPDFPVIEDTYQMTKEWAVLLPTPFNRRIEGGDLIIWKPGFTIYIAVWNNDRNLSVDKLFDQVKSGISPDATDVLSESQGDILYFSYRLNEESGDNRAAAFYCYAVSSNGYVQAAMYFDSENDTPFAKKIWRSLHVTAP